MNWITALILGAYIGVCEFRAPNAQACDGRWSIAIGVLVPSPLSPVGPALGRLAGQVRRRDDQREPRV